MLPVNAVGERLEGKPHEPFDGGELETERPMEKGLCPHQGQLANPGP